MPAGGVLRRRDRPKQRVCAVLVLAFDNFLHLWYMSAHIRLAPPDRSGWARRSPAEATANLANRSMVIARSVRACRFCRAPCSCPNRVGQSDRARGAWRPAGLPAGCWLGCTARRIAAPAATIGVDKRPVGAARALETGCHVSQRPPCSCPPWLCYRWHQPDRSAPTAGAGPCPSGAVLFRAAPGRALSASWATTRRSP
jgi:hypothetical protein